MAAVATGLVPKQVLDSENFLIKKFINQGLSSDLYLSAGEASVACRGINRLGCAATSVPRTTRRWIWQ
jgi:hypothetical protein